MEPPSPIEKVNVSSCEGDVNKNNDLNDASHWLNNSIMIPDAVRSSSIAMIGNAASLAEELALTKVELNISKTRASRISEARPSLRLASLAHSKYGDTEELRRRLSVLEREKEKLALSEEQVTSLRRQVNDLRAELTQINEFNASERLNTDMWKARAEEETASRKLLEDKMQSEKACHDEEVYQLRNELAALRRENNKTVQEITGNFRLETEEKTAHLEKITTELRQKISSYDAKCSKLTLSLEESHVRIEELEAAVLDVNNHNESITECYNETIAKMEKEKELAMEITKQDYENRISKLIADAETDKKEYVTHRTMCKELRGEIESINRRYNDNRRQLIEAEDRLVEINSQLGRVRMDMEREKNEAVSTIRQQMRAEINEATDLAMKLRQEITDKMEELSELQAENRRVTQCIEDDKNKIVTAQADVEAARGRMERMMIQITELESEKNILQEELDAACEKCLLAIKDKEEVEEELRQTSSLYSRLRQMEEDHGMEKSSWTKGKLDLMRSESDTRRECARLQRENQDLKDALSRNSDQFSSTKKRQLEEIRRERDELINNNDALTHDNEVLKQQLSTTKLDLEMARSQAALIRNGSHSKPHSRENSFQRPSAFTVGKTARTKPLKDIDFNVQEPASRRGFKVEIPGPLLIQGIPTGNQLTLGNKPLGRGVRCVAVTGFDDKSVIESAVLELPDAEIHQIQSNSCSVPAELTHLITNGNMTIKLLAALVRGCWILPKAYVDASRTAGKWLPEAEYGFRHNMKPLQGKTVAFTKKFSQGRYGKTMEQLVEGGGGEVFKVEDDSCTDHCDFVMCQNTERELYLSNGCTWEQMVSRIYPQKIGEGTTSQRSSLIPHGRIPVTA